MAHPLLHAELREEIQTSALAALLTLDALKAPGTPSAGTAVRVLVMVETACTALAAAAGAADIDSQAPVNTVNTPV